jgi:hypothetical protein
VGFILRDFNPLKVTTLKLTVMGRDSVPLLPLQTAALRYIPGESIVGVFFYFNVRRKSRL